MPRFFFLVIRSAYHLYGKPGNSGENSNGTVYSGGNFPGKNNTFRGITFFPFLPKQREYSVPFVCITSARLQVERKRKIYLYFVNGTLNPVPVFGAKKYQYHLTDVFHQIPVQKIYILDNYTGAFRKLAKAKINVLNKTRGKS